MRTSDCRFDISPIAAYDDSCLSTVSGSGWPYVQHRGGDTGFVRIIDDHTIGLWEGLYDRKDSGLHGLQGSAQDVDLVDASGTGALYRKGAALLSGLLKESLPVFF